MITTLTCLLAFSLPAAPPGDPIDLSYYLPDDATLDTSIPTPADVMGTEVGEWHVRHDQILAYFRSLEAASPRIQIIDYGRTHEQRPLILAVVTSEKNQGRLEEIRQAHIDRALGALGRSDAPREKDPAVLWMGYSVHGNESSGANVSLLLGYYLAAAQGAWVNEFLDDTVVLIDVCLNPDGLDRFAHWANVHRGKNLVGDPNHREHREAWPSGRTNHYWFDLNRDWLLLTHPESRGRLEQFHRWKPNLLTDYHEMGTNSTYFFQPGIPSRQNPRTPPGNLDLTREVARFHAEILDQAGSLYYTEESFDDFYYGKGSTYPDVNGSVGILFEQASSRGHLQDSTFGPLTFPFTIRNQFLTSISSLRAAAGLREKFLEYQASFYRSALTEAAQDPVKGYVFGSDVDAARNHHFVDILRRHQIEVYELARRIRNEGEVFEPGSAWIVPLEQHQYRLIQALFETRTKFADETFYDVSSWTLPLSFGLPYAALTAEEFGEELLGAAQQTTEFPNLDWSADDGAYAYLFEWDGYYAPRALNRLLQSEVRARVATKPFSVETHQGRKSFGYGTILVPMGPQEKCSREEILALLRDIPELDGIAVHSVATGLTATGVDLGSPSMKELEAPKPLLVIGAGVSSYEAGEVWHLLDQRFDMTISMVEQDRFASLDLHPYTHVVMVEGSYGSLSGGTRSRLLEWIRHGGVLIATKGATVWAEQSILGRKPEEEKPPEAGEAEAAEEKPERLSYADFESRSARGRIGGSIFEAEIDVSHPLCFGYRRPKISVFRNSSTFMTPEEDPLATPVRYTESPLLSGFASPKNQKEMAGTAVVNANRLGRGVVIRIVDNPNFRGAWYGTNKLFMNAILFGRVIKNTRLLDVIEDEHDH